MSTANQLLEQQLPAQQVTIIFLLIVFVICSFCFCCCCCCYCVYADISSAWVLFWFSEPYNRFRVSMCMYIVYVCLCVCMSVCSYVYVCENRLLPIWRRSSNRCSRHISSNKRACEKYTHLSSHQHISIYIYFHIFSL